LNQLASKANFKIMIQYIALVLLATQVSTYSIDGSKQLSKINLGKNQLANWQQNSQWSNCWRDAILALEEGCKQDNTNDESRGKLAVALANCHLSRSGLATYHCTNQMTVRECTKDMLSSNVAFHTYTEFTTHVGKYLYFYLTVKTIFVFTCKARCFNNVQKRA
jgi:hypothetical protein